MFYIKQIVVFTKNDNESILDLKPGLNIVYGESNTGKSLIVDCIDYLYGAEEHRFDDKLQITAIKLVLDVDGEVLNMYRNINSNDITVSGTVAYINNGVYKIKKGKKVISRVWLRLMGIENETEIFQTLSGKTQRLTLRTFYHTLLINEDRVHSMSSILLPAGKYKNSNTATMTALLYLATKENFIEKEKIETKDVKKAKKEAVKTFVNRSLNILAAQKTELLGDNSTESPEKLRKKIDNAIDAIGATENALKKIISEREELASKVISIDGKINENKVIMNRNDALKTQYESDIRRLTFIAEGDIHSSELQELSNCPFCDSQLSKNTHKSCIDAAISEVHKIDIQLRDLRSVQKSISEEIESYFDEKTTVLKEIDKLDILISSELKPQIKALKQDLSDYKIALRQANTKEMFDNFENVLYSQATISEEDESEEFKFDLREKIEKFLLSGLNEILKVLLEECQYKHFANAYFDLEDNNDDVIINGHLKRSQGKGFRAFINTILAMAIQIYLDKYGHYQPHMLIVDSPIMSLKEKEDHLGEEKMSETMKSGLFRYLLSHQDNRQTIIIENVIPPMDYSDANMIEFTKDENRGRYGLINEYRE